jgi:predicted PurR-regulated permease PerM
MAGMDPRSGVLAGAERSMGLRDTGVYADVYTGTERRLGERRRGERLAAEAEQELSDTQFFRRTVLVVSLIIFTGLVLALIWYASDVFLVLFAGILLAVLLRAPTNWLVQRMKLTENTALSISIVGLLLSIVLLVYMFAVPLADQIGQLLETLPQSMARMREWIWQYRWAQPLQPLVAELGRMRIDFQLLGRAGGLIGSTMAAIGGVGVALFIGIYLAAQPRLYQRGLMHLLPRKGRPRAYEVMDEIGMVLRW